MWIGVWVRRRRWRDCLVRVSRQNVFVCWNLRCEMGDVRMETAVTYTSNDPRTNSRDMPLNTLAPGTRNYERGTGFYWRQ